MVYFQISYRKTDKETHKSSKLEFFENFLALQVQKKKPQDC